MASIFRIFGKTTGIVELYGDEHGKKYKVDLGDGCVNDLILDEGVVRVVSRKIDVKDSACRASIDTQGSCLRLEAHSDEIHVSPSYCFAVQSHIVDAGEHAWLRLQPSTAERRESIYLRPGDKVRLGPERPILAIEASTSDIRKSSPTNNVQVGSSQPESNVSPQKAADLRANLGQDDNADARRSDVVTTTSHNVQEVAESMGPADILVDRSTTFTESLLRSTSTPKASLAQSDKIEDTPALDGGRYYDVAAMGALETTTTTATNTAAGSVAGVVLQREETRDGKETGAEIKEVDGREGTPTFYTPRPSMSTTTSPVAVAKKIVNGTQVGKLKEPSKSPVAVRARTYSQKGRKRSIAEVATGNCMAGVKPKLTDMKLETVEMDSERLPEVAESPSAMASPSVLGSRDAEEQSAESEAAKEANDQPEKTVEKAEPLRKAELKQTTPASKRKLSDDDGSTPKTSRKRSKAAPAHEQDNKENKLPAANQDCVSSPSVKNVKTLSSHPPTVSREARSSTAKTASPASRKYRPYHGPGLNVAFSNSSVTSKPSLMRFLQLKNCSVVEKISDKGTDILCIGQGEVKKTSKLLLALAYGKTIITDDWVTRSSRTGNLLDPNDFAPHAQHSPDDPLATATATTTTPAPAPTAPSAASLSTSTSTSTSTPSISFAQSPRHNRKNLLAGKSVYFTPALKKDYAKGFADIQEIVMAVGAKGVVSMPARDITPGPHYIVLALESGDLDAPTLADKGAVCYGKDLISMSIMRGKLDLESEEFRIGVVGSASAASAASASASASASADRRGKEVGMGVKVKNKKNGGGNVGRRRS